MFANKTRKMTKKLGARTMPDYFEKRYNSKGMKILSAVIIFVFLVPYSAAASKSPEMGVVAMAISFVIVPVVSLLTKNKDSENERVEEIFACYNED